MQLIWSFHLKNMELNMANSYHILETDISRSRYGTGATLRVHEVHVVMCFESYNLCLYSIELSI